MPNRPPGNIRAAVTVKDLQAWLTAAGIASVYHNGGIPHIKFTIGRVVLTGYTYWDDESCSMGINSVRFKRKKNLNGLPQRIWVARETDDLDAFVRTMLRTSNAP